MGRAAEGFGGAVWALWTHLGTSTKVLLPRDSPGLLLGLTQLEQQLLRWAGAQT